MPRAVARNPGRGHCVPTRMQIGVALRASLGATLILAGSVVVASGQQPGCFRNGDIVGVEGSASPGPVASQWVLNLPRPVCIAGRVVSDIRIIGVPPPLGVPLELTGKLLIGRDIRDARIFAALAVIRGRRIRQAASVPGAAAPFRPPPSAPQPRRMPTCDSPPYGGTPADYRNFVGRFGKIINPGKILAGICKAKFANASRAGLYKLGLSDAKINAESTERLAAETVVALKELVNTIE